MALVTFTPFRAPDPGTSDKPKINLFENEFGDGYTQRSPKGINHIQRVLSVTWSNLIPDEAKTLTDFFFERGGYKPFLYTPSDEVKAVRWICKEYDDKRGDYGFRTVSATFEQDFSIQT